MLNREGIALLHAVIGMQPSLRPLITKGDCKQIAIEMNLWMPSDMQLRPADVYEAIKDRSDFGGPKMNAEILRARIDKMPVLYSARLSGDYQAMVNELNAEPDAQVSVTAADVIAAMSIRPVQQPTNVVAGSAKMVGVARVG